MSEKVFKINEIEEIAKDLLSVLSKTKKNRATVLAFYGDLGAGKTTTTQEIARQLGVLEKVISPTFVIMKKYNIKDGIFKKLIHIDAYRFNKSEEILILGWEEMLIDKDNLIIVEWPERVSKHLPEDICSVELGHRDNDTRSIKICYNV